MVAHRVTSLGLSLSHTECLQIREGEEESEIAGGVPAAATGERILGSRGTLLENGPDQEVGTSVVPTIEAVRESLEELPHASGTSTEGGGYYHHRPPNFQPG